MNTPSYLKKQWKPSRVWEEYVRHILQAIPLGLFDKFGKVDAWKCRMEMRTASIQQLPSWECGLLEARNRQVYFSAVPLELDNLSVWLDQQTANVSQPAKDAPVSDVNDPRYGPTAQYLFHQLPSSVNAFEGLAEAMTLWAGREPASVSAFRADHRGTAFYGDLSLIDRVARMPDPFVDTGNPLEPFATADGNIHLRINDFPDELFWTILVGGKEGGSFNNWPSVWRKPKRSSSVPLKMRGKHDEVWFQTLAQYEKNYAAEKRNRSHLSPRFGFSTEGLTVALEGPPLSVAGLAIRTWHWRLDLRRHAIASSHLNFTDQRSLQHRHAYVYGGQGYRHPPQPHILEIDRGDTSYEMSYGLSYGYSIPRNLTILRMAVESEPIQFGPTVGYFFGKALQAGGGDDTAFALMLEWAMREPPSYQEYLRQLGSPVPGDYGITSEVVRWIDVRLAWKQTDDLIMLYSTEVNHNGQRIELAVRLNDFPDERMFSLVENGTDLGDFNDWPALWTRPGPARAADIHRDW